MMNRSQARSLGWIAALIYAIAAGLRLARFNVETVSHAEELVRAEGEDAVAKDPRYDFVDVRSLPDHAGKLQPGRRVVERDTDRFGSPQQTVARKIGPAYSER